MADRKNYNTYVYKTEKGTKGNKYHYYSDYRYIKDKSIKRVLKNDARKDKLTLCSECRKKANNHEHQNFGFKKYLKVKILFLIIFMIRYFLILKKKRKINRKKNQNIQFLQ